MNQGTISYAPKTSKTQTQEEATTNVSYYDRVLSIIETDEFIDGELSKSDVFMDSLDGANQYNLVVNALLQVFENSSQFSDTEQIFTGILTMFACRPFKELNPYNQKRVLEVVKQLLNCDNIYVRDKAIQTFEKWNRKEFISILESIKEEEDWLLEYIEKVIYYLKKDGVD